MKAREEKDSETGNKTRTEKIEVTSMKINKFVGKFLLLMVLTTQSIFTSKTGKCTKNACMFCMTDGSKSWCAKCGNGHYLSSLKKGEGKCLKTLAVENCYQPDPYLPTNRDKCGGCRSGFYLSENKKRCFKYIDFKCDLPYMWDSNRLCGGCKHHYLDNDYTKCSKNKDLLDHCLYGDVESSKRCLKCKPGYIATKDRKTCIKFEVKGCKARHPANKEKCLLCDHELHYFAVEAEKDGKNIYQVCKKESHNEFGGRVKVWVVFVFLVMVLGGWVGDLVD